MSADEIAEQVAQRVREVVAEAEERAGQIVAEAEAEAERIRSAAEADARDRIEAARRALAGETQPGGPETPTAPPVPRPEPVPDPEEPPPPKPPPEPDQPAAASANGDDQAARLVAMKMALDGKGRDEIERELNEKLGPGDRAALLDDVLSRVRK